MAQWQEYGFQVQVLDAIPHRFKLLCPFVFVRQTLGQCDELGGGKAFLPSIQHRCHDVSA